MASRLIVVIPTAGRCELLPKTLASLGDCERPEVYERTIVVENGAPGGAEEAVANSSKELRATYLHVERANKSDALNHVFETFNDEDLIYLVDDDVRFSKNTLVDYVKASAGVERGCVYGGPLRIDSDGEPPARWREFLPGSMKGWEPAIGEFRPGNSFFLGANWAVFAGDVRDAGGFDTRFGPGSPLGATGQEWTMQIALRRRGAQFVYLPNAIVWHHVDFNRFSHDFLLRRKFRGGLEAGIRAADFMNASPRWRDLVFRPMLKARMKLWWNELATRLCKLLSRDVAQFKHELNIEHAKGFLHSYPLSMDDITGTRSS